MSITKEEKASYIQQYATSAKDTGNTSAQVALLTHRINAITQHLQGNKHDQHSKRGLINLVNKRKSLLKYLKRKDTNSYSKLLLSLNIRA